MKNKIALLIVMMFCVSCLSACVKSEADGVDDGSVKVEDIEDVAIDKGIVTIVNLMGKDAVELWARESGTKEWSKTILSEDTLRTNYESTMTYNYTKSNKNIFDIRLVFEDGTSKEFTNCDFSSKVFLGEDE